MRKLGFALGTLAGMAMSAANERERRAYELNELGIRLANEYHYNEALNYFLEANELMPNNQDILNNIQICREALREINKLSYIQTTNSDLQPGDICMIISGRLKGQRAKVFEIGRYADDVSVQLIDTQYPMMTTYVKLHQIKKVD